MCLSICRNAERPDGETWYPYAGLEWQCECFCGDEPEFGFVWSWPDKCNDRCTGDSFQNCGGTNAISIWRTPPKRIEGECFYDFPSPRRVFEHGYSIDGLEDLTIQNCKDICETAGLDLTFSS